MEPSLILDQHKMAAFYLGPVSIKTITGHHIFLSLTYYFDNISFKANNKSKFVAMYLGIAP
jgi:hypothetical protein